MYKFRAFSSIELINQAFYNLLLILPAMAIVRKIPRITRGSGGEPARGGEIGGDVVGTRDGGEGREPVGDDDGDGG